MLPKFRNVKKRIQILTRLLRYLQINLSGEDEELVEYVEDLLHELEVKAKHSADELERRLMQGKLMAYSNDLLRNLFDYLYNHGECSYNELAEVFIDNEKNIRGQTIVNALSVLYQNGYINKRYRGVPKTKNREMAYTLRENIRDEKRRAVKEANKEE